MKILMWEPTDIDWWIGLRRQWQPTVGEEQLRLLASGRVARFVHRTVAWRGNDRVGYAMIAITPGEQTAVAQVLVEPVQRGQGIGAALWGDLMTAGAGLDLMVWMADDDLTSQQVAEHWGFRVVSHAIRSRIDLTDIGLDPHMPEPFQVRVVEVADSPDAKRGVDLVLAGSETNPEAVELGWRHSVSDLEQMFPAIVWVVIEADSSPVAIAAMQRQDDEPWHVIYTGVLPEYRGRGLARLAKAHLHALAYRRGARAMVTDNEARNVGILALNSSLGYRKIGGEIRLVRDATTAAVR